MANQFILALWSSGSETGLGYEIARYAFQPGISDLGLLADLFQLLEERTRAIVAIVSWLVAFVNDVHLAQVLLKGQRLDGDNHGRLLGEDVVLMPGSGGNVHGVARFPFDLLIVDVAVTFSPQDDNDRLIVLMGH